MIYRKFRYTPFLIKKKHPKNTPDKKKLRKLLKMLKQTQNNVHHILNKYIERSLN